MNRVYKQATEVIRGARIDIESILDAPGVDNKTAEDREAYSLLNDIMERMTIAEGFLEYLQKPTEEGTLEEDPLRRKFYVSFDNGKEGHMLSCGSPLELLIDEEWEIGRVEAKDGNYYFYGEGRPYLCKGMRARIRV